MPRCRRLLPPGVAVHIVQRGNDRAPCFRVDSDYRVYLANLAELALKTDCLVHAYCLMTNHVHLLITPQRSGACSALMRNLGQRYVQYFNRRHGRTGTLWEGRFHSCIVESATYVLACHRYIELNPVRAGMVSHPRKHAWSSFSANAGEAPRGFLVPHLELEALGAEGEARSVAYRALFDDGVSEVLLKAIREATSGGLPLASNAWLASAAALGLRTKRRKAGRRPEEK